MENKSYYALMYAGFLVYSFSIVFSKLASLQAFLSAPYLLCFFGMVFALGVYAVLWQQILKKIPLSVAMANKPVALALSLLWAFVFFKEPLTAKTLVGIALVLAGMAAIGVGAVREK